MLMLSPLVLRPALALLVLHAVATGQQWHPTAEQAPSVSFVATAFDTARGRIVGFNGWSVHEWDGVAWHLAGGATSPAANSPAIAYDPVRRRTVLLRENGTTWEWDGSAWTQAAPVASPPARTRVALVWDGVNQKVLAFGGVLNGSGPLLQETWLYNGTTWTQPPVGSRPSARSGVQLSWDSMRQRVVLFGGGNSSTWLDETWEWDGTNWLQFFPATSPPGRDRAGLSFDAVRNRTVLFGGGQMQDHWEWNGAQWTEVTVATRPERRYGHGQAFDPTRGTTLVWGGVTNVGQTNDTWEWNGTAWARVVIAPILVSGAATDLQRGRLVTLGSGGSPNAVWLWDGRAWLRIDRPILPSWRPSTAMAYDQARQRVLLFGGGLLGSGQTLGDTWEWDGFSWLNRAPATAPPARTRHALAYLGSASGVFLFGGMSGVGLPMSDMWHWNGNVWIDLTPISGSLPPARAGHGMAAAFNAVYLFGGTDGITTFDDTWIWTGASWAPLTPATVPPARHRHGMSADLNGNSIRIAGGIDANDQDLADSWRWNGSDWSPAPALPQPQRDLALAIDPLRQLPLAIGDQTGSRVEIQILAPSPSGTLAYGQGCAGSHGVPQLRAGGRPYLGNTAFRLHVGEVPAAALTAIFIDVFPASLPLSGGCTQLVGTANTLVLGVANAAHFFGVNVPIPGSAGLLGAVFFTQAAALDANGAFQNLASVTGGLQLTLGH